MHSALGAKRTPGIERGSVRSQSALASDDRLGSVSAQGFRKKPVDDDHDSDFDSASHTERSKSKKDVDQ